MNSNTLNPLDDLVPEDIVTMLQKMADMPLSSSQAENVGLIVSSLKINPTILDVVEACEDVLGLREFAVRLGAFCLPGEGYKAIFDREFSEVGKRE